KAEQDGAPPPKQGRNIADALADAIKKTQTSIQAKAHKPHISTSTKKTMIIAAVVLVVLPVAALLAVIIPGQIARSSAFGAYEAGNYPLALRELRAFLADNPGDNEVAYYAAQAASRTGEFDFAARVMSKISVAPEYARDPEFIFAYALMLAPGPNTTGVLNKLAGIAPKHAGGRLLRGIMLTKEKYFSRAREDFLEADSIIRGAPNYDGSDLRAVHRRIAENKNIMPIFAAASAAGADSPVFRRFAARINAPAPDGVFINRYASVPPPAEADDYGDGDLIGFYYAVMLLLAGQFREADVEFSKLPAAVSGSPEVENLKAIRHAVRGEYRKAADKFAAISGQSPELMLNLANASFNLNPSAESAAAAAALYDKALAAEENPPPVARHNRAVLRLITGDNAGAREDLAALKDGAPPQTPFLRVLAELSQNPQSDAINELLKAAGNFPGADSIRAAHYTAGGKHNLALRLLGKNAGDGEWDAAARAYVRYLADVRLFMRAYHALRARAPKRGAETRYQNGALELAVGNLPAAEETLKLMETENGEDFWTDALRGLVEHTKNNSEQALAHITRAAQKAETDAQRRNIAVDAADILLAAAPRLLENMLESLKSLDPVAETLLARLRAKKDPKNAAKQARAAVARYPVFAVQYHASYALAEAGYPEEALTLLLAAAAEWNPVNVPLLTRIVELQIVASDPDGAAATKQRIAGIKWEVTKGGKDDLLALGVDSPNDSEMIKLLTEAINNNTSPEDALKRFGELLKSAAGKDEKVKLLFQRATFYYAVRQYPEAEQDLNDTLPELDPETRQQALEYLGKTLERQKKYGKAAAVYQQLADNAPEIPLYRRLAGRALSNYDSDAAVQYLRETAAMFPANIESYFELSAVLQKTQNIQEATAVLQKAARIAPLYVKIYAMLTRAQRSHNPEAAKENSVIASKLVL
ncbi:MAG: tetratricopeptide repeat protein, partial [Betaproteobacteria bacterium]|nr:tetratricopeptide repeat protein [Betaproteobacteria bacterium]